MRLPAPGGAVSWEGPAGQESDLEASQGSKHWRHWLTFLARLGRAHTAPLSTLTAWTVWTPKLLIMTTFLPRDRCHGVTPGGHRARAHSEPESQVDIRAGAAAREQAPPCCSLLPGNAAKAATPRAHGLLGRQAPESGSVTHMHRPKQVSPRLLPGLRLDPGTLSPVQPARGRGPLTAGNALPVPEPTAPRSRRRSSATVAGISPFKVPTLRTQTSGHTTSFFPYTKHGQLFRVCTWPGIRVPPVLTTRGQHTRYRQWERGSPGHNTTADSRGWGLPREARSARIPSLPPARF